MRYDLREGFPLLTTKQMSFKNIVVEMLWFLSGQTDIGILQKHGCKFWDPWADSRGKVPSAYGNFWRHFPIHHQTMREYIDYNDQLAWAQKTLRENPMSRRVVISAWAPGNAQTSKLPPCHCLFVFNVQNLHTHCRACNGAGKQYIPSQGDDAIVVECERCNGVNSTAKPTPHLCLHLTQRSCDLGLGVPYNIASYALLLELFARFVGLPAGIISHTLVDAHIYTAKPNRSMAEYDHIPALTEQLSREPRQRPTLYVHPEIRDLDDIPKLFEADTGTVMQHFRVEGYRPHPAISMKVAV